MKVVLLAGGFGTRISEESRFKPKPMIEIGDRPILWHIMKYYSGFGFNEFVICCGYKGEVIKDYFINYQSNNSDFTVTLKNNGIITHKTPVEDWKVTLVDTGLNTMTGGRIKRIENFIDEDDFMLTYGDGLCDVNLDALLDFHRKHGKVATITTVKPEGRFGVLNIQDEMITDFREKSANDMGWINGGFMVLNKRIFRYIKDDTTVFEKEPLERIAAEKELVAFKHNKFWRCMDTQRDKLILENLWESGNVPWKNWVD